jgi:predicted unusual protein kinase regulating ubiquinone biosynthesis (AarF/ABC1/UbiB family)
MVGDFLYLLRIYKLLVLLLISVRRGTTEKIGLKMGELHGISQKVGQHLTLYSSDEVDDFERLYSHGRVENICLIRLLDEAGLDYAKNSVECVAQASIGQVYKVDSVHEKLAIKAKYPKIAQQMITDFKLVRFLAKLTRILPLGLPIINIVEIIYEQMLRECDYSLEAQTQEIVRGQFSKFGNINIPAIYRQYSNNEMIISEWVNGLPLNQFLQKANLSNRQKVFKSFFIFQFYSIFSCGIVHCDPHPGNFLVEETNGTTILHVIDFGCVVHLSVDEIKIFRRLFLGEYSDIDQLKLDFIALDVTKDTVDTYELILDDLVSIVLEAFYTDGEYDFDHWRLTYKLNTLLSSREWDKPFVLSAKLMFIARMFQGLYYYARRFNIQFNWRKEIRNIIYTVEEDTRE